MKKIFILQVSALLVLAACQPNSEFAKKNFDGSTLDISRPGDEKSIPADLDRNSGSCNEISSYMLCVSSGCEPVFRTDQAEIAYSQEEDLFSRCMPKPAPGDSSGDSPVVVILPPADEEDPKAENPSPMPIPPKSSPDEVTVIILPPSEGPILPPKSPIEDGPVVVLPPPSDSEGEEPVGEEPSKSPGKGSDKPRPGDVAEVPGGEEPSKGPGKGSEKPKPGDVAEVPGGEEPSKGPGKGSDKPKPGDVAEVPKGEEPSKGPGKGSDKPKPGDVAEVPGGGKPSIPANCDALIPGASAKEKGQRKVIICHNTSSKSRPSHTIEIACPALHTHTSHHLDTLGPCKDE